MIKRIGFKRKLEYFGLKLLTFLVQKMTHNSALKFGDDLGWIGFNLFKIRRKHVLTQLTRVFGDEKSEEELKKIALGAYQNFCKSMIEYARIPIISKEELLEFVEFENIEYFDETLEKGKGAIIVTGHFGSWEMLGAATVAQGYPVDFLVGRQHNQYVDDYMNRVRSDAGIGIISLKLALRGVIRSLRKNRMIAMLSDQDAGKSSVFVEFLDLPARTPSGPALFSLKMESPLIPVFIIRQRDNRHHKAIIEKPIEYELTGDRERDIENLTQAYTNILEKYVREYPDHWFWLHRRWKRQPKKNGKDSLEENNHQ